MSCVAPVCSVQHQMSPNPPPAEQKKQVRVIRSVRSTRSLIDCLDIARVGFDEVGVERSSVKIHTKPASGSIICVRQFK